MIQFVLLISRQGKVQLTKWYSPYSQKERTKVIRELSGVILSRGPKLCNFVEWRGYKVVNKRYASLYFCMCIDQDDNELEVLEIIHHYVEILDRYFGSVCELDLIFNFHNAYYILDELLIAGELQESSKKTIARLIAAQDSLVETAKEQADSLSIQFHLKFPCQKLNCTVRNSQELYTSLLIRSAYNSVINLADASIQLIQAFLCKDTIRLEHLPVFLAVISLDSRSFLPVE